MLYGSKSSGGTVWVLKSNLMKAVRSQLKFVSSFPGHLLPGWEQTRRKTQYHVYFWDTDRHPRSHASLLAAVVKPLEWSRRRLSLCFITRPGTRYMVLPQVHSLGRCQRWMNIITWVCGQPSWHRNLIPCSRFAESFNQDLRWENCHYLPKAPSELVLFPVIGSCSAAHMLLFYLRQGQGCQKCDFFISGFIVIPFLFW